MFFMDRRLKTWEMALLFGSLCGLAAGAWLGQEHRELADHVVRIHVVANSDSPEDQALKLAVRDGVLECAQRLYPEGAGREEALEILSEHLGELEQAGACVVKQWGAEQGICASVEESWFPTKWYDGFGLPAGKYAALKIVLGEGEGKNWWCVAFPPLCLGAASVSIDQAVEAGQFTQEQADLMTGDTQGYVLKFKSLELLGQLKGWLAGMQ